MSYGLHVLGPRGDYEPGSRRPVPGSADQAPGPRVGEEAGPQSAGSIEPPTDHGRTDAEMPLEEGVEVSPDRTEPNDV